MNTRIRALLCLGFLTAWPPLVARAQDARLLSPDWWGTSQVEHFAQAGLLRLDPLTRPWNRADVVRALDAVDTSAVSPAVAATLARLRADLAVDDSAALAADVYVGGQAGSDASKWTLFPTKDSAGAYPLAGVRAALQLPHLALVSSPQIDNRLKWDPWYRGKKDRFVSGRNPEAYVRASWPLVDVFLGQVDRNWGPAGIEGLVLSPSPYSYDHFFLRIGPPRFRLEMLATQLDDRLGTDTSQHLKRFLSVHRLVVQPSSSLTFSVFEAALYADQHNNRNFEPWYLNPVNLWLLAQENGAKPENALVGADAVHQGRHLTLAGQLYIDDFQVDRGGPASAGNNEPPSYGLTLSATQSSRGYRARWQALYTRVTNLSYRTPQPAEGYLYQNVGIGRNFSDYDQATVKLSWLANLRLLAGLEATLLRQGEGDPRAPYPAESLYATTPTIFSGVVQRTVRLAGSAQWWPSSWLQVSGEVGVHFVSNAAHVAGASQTRWVWRLKGEVRRRWTGRLPE